MKRELLVDPHYSSGCYFQEAARHAVDAPFKATSFIHLLRHVSDRYSLCIQSYADVGCGSGHVTTLVADALSALYEPLKVAKGYDVSPHVRHVQRDGIEFVHADFRASSEYFDLATLFDVFEHVPDPVGFIKGVAEQCDLIGFHVPLDANWNCFLRDMPRAKLHDPGHLIYLDAAGALNLLAMAGLRVLDYQYTIGSHAPSGRQTLMSKCAHPVRIVAAKLSPWLLSKVLGGVSLIALAATPRGLHKVCRR